MEMLTSNDHKKKDFCIINMIMMRFFLQLIVYTEKKHHTSFQNY